MDLYGTVGKLEFITPTWVLILITFRLRSSNEIYNSKNR